MNTYPKDYISQIYLVAYGVEGLADNVEPEVYDDHEAFEIDKTKMKMLVPLDMNGKQLMNVNLGMKFSDIFTWENCYVTLNRNTGIVVKLSDDSFLAPTTPTVLCFFYFANNFKEMLTSSSNFYISGRRYNDSVRYSFRDYNKIFCIFKKFQHGFSNIRFYDINNQNSGNNRFPVFILFAKG